MNFCNIIQNLFVYYGMKKKILSLINWSSKQYAEKFLLTVVFYFIFVVNLTSCILFLFGNKEHSKIKKELF